MALTDFFGNIFTKKILGKGLDAAFGGDGNGGVPQIQYNIPSYGQYEMPISEQSSPAGKAEEIEVSDYDLIRTMWNKRLFGNDSYTNITLPRL